MRYWENIHSEKRGIYDINLCVTDEDTTHGWFDPADEKRLQESVDAGKAVHFVAKVTASIDGIDLGEDHLGSCYYDNYKQFFEERGGYYDQMVDDAINQAKEKINRLLKAVIFETGVV